MGLGGLRPLKYLKLKRVWAHLAVRAVVKDCVVVNGYQGSPSLRDSHDATSSLSLPPFMSPPSAILPFYGSPGVSPPGTFCNLMRQLYLWNKQVTFCPLNSLFYSPWGFPWRIFRRRGCLWTHLHGGYLKLTTPCSINAVNFSTLSGPVLPFNVCSALTTIRSRSAPLTCSIAVAGLSWM